MTRCARSLSALCCARATPCVLAALTAAALLTPVLVAATIPADDARIVKVTVYRDRAEVIERAVVQLPAGSSTIEFGGIPFGVESDSVRVAAEGVPATLGTVEIRNLVEEPVETPEWQAAQDEVRRLERAIAALDEDDAVDQELLKFLRAMGKVTAESSARDMGEARADPEAMNGIYEMMQSRLRALANAKLERGEQRRDLREELELATAHMRTLRPAASIRSRVAAVAVESSGAGRLTLRLSYLVPGASWRPTYRATLDAEAGELALVAEGVVRQSTGQDWSGVELHLSSASPAMGVQPPMLMSWFLRPVNPNSIEESQGALAMEAKDARFYQNTYDLAPGIVDGHAEPVPAAPLETEIVRSAYNVAFRVPGSSDVPADGTDHRMVLRQETLRANVVHRTVPGADDRAFLTAVTTSPDAFPLLAGPVRVFTGGAYLGSFSLKETGPGVELTIPFGVDNRIEILRVPEPEMKSREGWTGKQKQVHKMERTIVHNLMDRPATLVLEDRLPVPEDERIDVQVGDATTQGYRDSERRPGVKLWTIELAPGEKREIVLDYTVRWPRDLYLPGLE
jgi:uncharacterized protein (TIGR02231 family)